MKITMLGTTGSGKTVYMSAMGELFFHSTLKGYRIGNRQYDREDVADDSFAYRGFEEIGSLYGDGTFPYGTTSSMIMPLELRYKGEHVIDIDWIDYRGQAIAELARRNIQSSNEEVHTTLLASDVIMVFVDAAILKATKNDMTARKRTGANAISELLMRVHKDKQFDIIFLLTKADSETINLEQDFSSLKARIGSLYSVFLSETHTDISQYHVIPVGACGVGNVHSSIKLVENNRGGKELKIQHNIIVGADELEPLNIASSFAQALLLSLYRERNNLNTSVTELAKKLDELQNDFGPVKNIIDILFFSSKRRQGINSLQVEIEKNRSEIRNLFSHEERLLSIANSSQ